MFDGFAETMIDAGDLRLLVRFAGDGPAVLLLHGHPALVGDLAPRRPCPA